MSEIIKNHKELAEIIKGKKVLHLNSLGKDSAVTLEWLTTVAKPSCIISLNYKFMAEHPADNMYLNYQKSKYPDVEFIIEPHPFELGEVVDGFYQCPIKKMTVINHFEHYGFDMGRYNLEMADRHNADYICMGTAKYESVTRASLFHKRGILTGKMIYPLGMMTKKEVINIIKMRNIKLHPCYKFSQSTLDAPSYYKMRSAMIASKEYRENILRVFPLLALDAYRYEKLLKRK